MATLLDLKPGQTARIEAISGDPSLVQRLYEFGMLEGEEVQFVASAPLGDPLEFRVGNTRFSLRKAEASQIQIIIPT